MLFFIVVVFMSVSAEAKIISQSVRYQSEGLNLLGYLAYDDAKTGKLPGVLVVLK